jgi:uncharacterized protein YcaQ
VFATFQIRYADQRRLSAAFRRRQSLFPPTTLKRAFDRLGFVQADPILAPARAQDLILRHRVKNYRAGDLERRYCKLGIEEAATASVHVDFPLLQRMALPITIRTVRYPGIKIQSAASAPRWFGMRRSAAS